MTHSVLFVCLGNICRSPMAEAVFAHMVSEQGYAGAFRIDSAGTAGYHIGEPPDARSAKTCRKNGVPVNSRCRQVAPEDFTTFDWILCMDESNLRNLKAMQPAGATAQIKLFGEFDPEGQRIIEDPYYGGQDGFDVNFAQVTRCSRAFLAHLGFKVTA